MEEKKLPLVSVIIPLPKINDYIRESLEHFSRIDYPKLEIIVLPDKYFGEELRVSGRDDIEVRVIESGAVGPAEKRDLGARYANGEILAFIDDDAYPRQDWLKNAVRHFLEDGNVGAVGGPAVTPPNEPFWNKISGFVYESFLTSGPYVRRYKPVNGVIEDDDIPSVNLIVRKDVFQQIGGFDSSFYPGEDTKLCLEIKKRGWKILYDPNVLVYHHRRPLFWKHFKQIANYALHRGYFVKKYPETSFRLPYFIPSLFLLGLVLGIPLSFVSPLLKTVYLGTLGFYFLLNIFSNIHLRNPIYIFLTTVGVFLSHITYGIYFIKGLLTKHLKR